MEGNALSDSMRENDYSEVKLPEPAQVYTPKPVAPTQPVAGLRNGSPHFYQLVAEMSDVHDRKSHDYANNDNPFGNYHFAGELSKLFNNPKDAGFIGRVGEKLYRLANIENSGKSVRNETVEDTEVDICTIITLWVADRRDRRAKEKSQSDSLGNIE